MSTMASLNKENLNQMLHYPSVGHVSLGYPLTLVLLRQYLMGVINITEARVT